MSLLARLAALILSVCVALSSIPAVQGSSIKDVATAYIADLNVLFFFGGWDERTPIIASAGFINLTAPFSVDSPPITNIPSVPIVTSRLVPNIVKKAIGDSFDIIISGGVTPPIPFQSGVFVPGTTAWTYSINKDAGGGAQASLRATVNGGRNSEGLPFGPGFQYGATTADGVFENTYAFGGRTFPTPFFSQLKVIDKFGAYSTVSFNNNSAPLPRADSQLVRVNTTHLILAGGDGNSTKFNDIWLFNIPQAAWIRYPHSFIQPHAFGGFVVYTAPSSTRYVIHIGRDSPFIEYFSLSANGPPQAADATGQGPSSLEQPSAVMIGDQMVIVGGFTKAGDPDQRFFRVLKVKESEGSKLSFEWQSTFSPIAKPTAGSGSPPPAGSPTSGGGGGKEKEKPAWMLPLIISGSALGGLLAIGVAVFLFRRNRSQRATGSKAHQRDADLADADSAVSFKQPLVTSSTPMNAHTPAVEVGTAPPLAFPAPVADVSTYPHAPPHPVSTSHDLAALSKSTPSDGFAHHLQPHAARDPSLTVDSSDQGLPHRHASVHSSVNVVVEVGTGPEEDVVYLPQPPQQPHTFKSPAPHEHQSPFETLLLPTSPTPIAEGGVVMLADVDQQSGVAGLQLLRQQRDVQQHSTMATLYLPSETGMRPSHVTDEE